MRLRTVCAPAAWWLPAFALRLTRIVPAALPQVTQILRSPLCALAVCVSLTPPEAFLLSGTGTALALLPGLARHYLAWLCWTTTPVADRHVPLPRRVRGLSLPVSPCTVQVCRSFHPAHVFLTGSSAPTAANVD